MCVVSAMGDHYNKKFQDEDWLKRLQDFKQPAIQPQTSGFIVVPNPVSREEFEQLRKEIIEMKKILQVAKEYDARNNEPHCEMEEKVALLKKIAEAVGVNLDDIFKQQNQA